MIGFTFLKEDTVTNIQDIHGMECLTVNQSPPSIEFNNINYETDDGERETENAVYKPFDITVRFLLQFDNQFDYSIKNSEFLSFIYQRTGYYILYDLMPGKKYEVQVTDCNEEEKTSDGVVYEVTFNCFKAFSESIESTVTQQDIFNQDWQFSQGLLSTTYDYTFKKNNFTIYNLGDFTVDPRRRHYLRITIKGQSDEGLAVYNQTTGERFEYHASLDSRRGETLLIDGAYTYKNDVLCGIDTNGGIITLVPGANKIQILNTSAVDISFDFAFLYKT